MISFMRGFLFLMLCLILFFRTGPASALTWHIPNDSPSIQAGLAASTNGDTVLVACGTYLEYNITMKAGVTLLGESSDSSCVIIDAQNQGRILDCVNLTPLTSIIGITFRNGLVSEGWLTAMGGGIRCLASNVAISHCTFLGNSARIGAGFGASESTFEMNNCTFTSNSAIHPDWAAGGALWALECTGNIQNCIVLSNTAFSENPDDPGDGGGFFFNRCHLNVSDSLFQENSTAAGAGAFYSVTNDSSSFSNCDFISNTAGNGGAVYYESGATPHLESCTFSNNMANSGGAIATLHESYPSISNCFFEGNVATEGQGGAIDGWQSDFTINNSTFQNNSSVDGGGAAQFGGCTVEIANSLFVSNSTASDGGAIKCHFSNITASNCTLVGNSAISGAGIYCGVNSHANIDHTIIAFSESGASMAGTAFGFASLSCCNFFGNNAGDWVGEIASQIHTNNNLSADPQFCNMGNGEFTIFSNSPCAPDNQPGCNLIGALGIGCVHQGPEVRELMINEFVAENTLGLQDETGAYEDWVEIYNPSDEAINLSGLFLSDNIRFPQKWPFPDSTIPAGEYLLIICDNEPEDGPLHATFELDTTGGDLSLFDSAAGQYCDSRFFEQQVTNVSEGRRFDGHESWVFFAEPTPGAQNSPEATGIQLPQTMSSQIVGNYPNPFNPQTQILFRIGQSGQTTITIFDLRGRLVRTLLNESLSIGEHSVIWDGNDKNSVSAGSSTYFVQLQTDKAIDTQRIMLIK